MKYLKSIEITIPIRLLIPAVLIIMALTGRIGATIATFIAAFLIFILLLPDNL